MRRAGEGYWISRVRSLFLVYFWLLLWSWSSLFVIGIEMTLECSIATGPLNRGLTEQRALAKGKMFKRGATILLREAVDTEKLSEGNGEANPIPKKCVTDPKEIINELVGDYKFQFPAGTPSSLIPHLSPSSYLSPTILTDTKAPSSKTTTQSSPPSPPMPTPKSSPPSPPSKSPLPRATSSTPTAAPASSV